MLKRKSYLKGDKKGTRRLSYIVITESTKNAFGSVVGDDFVSIEASYLALYTDADICLQLLNCESVLLNQGILRVELVMLS